MLQSSKPAKLSFSIGGKLQHQAAKMVHAQSRWHTDWYKTHRAKNRNFL